MTAASRPVALLTGAAGGLGGGIARALARAGFDLILSDLEGAPGLVLLCDQIEAAGARATVVPQDLADLDGLPGLAARAQASFGRLDCLVNNAGVSVMARGDILDAAPESLRRCLAINLEAPFVLTQAVARLMLEAGDTGHRRSILTVSTVALDAMVAEVLAEYAMSKAGLSQMVRHFAVRLAPFGIDCFEIRPGMMRTDMTATSRAKYDQMIAAGAVPARRWGEVDEIGETVAALAGGALRYSVGQTIHVDGGFRLKTF